MVDNDQSRMAAAPPTWADPLPRIEKRPLWRRALPLLVWLGCLGVAVALLQALGNGRLAAPPLTDPGSWQAWAAGRDPLEVVMVVLRLVALAVAWYLTGVTSVSVIARLLRAARLVRVADALSVGPVRVLVQQALGIGLVAGVVATSMPGVATPGSAATPDGRADVVVMELVVDDGKGTDVAGDADQPTGEVAAATDTQDVMVPVPAPDVRPSPGTSPAAGTATPAVAEPEVAEPDVAPPVPASSAGASAAPSTTAPAATAAATQEVRVEPGDHFWGLAERAVADHLGRPGSEDEVLAHWTSMLAANAGRLVVTGNPDVLLPGQLVVVPDVAEALP